MTDPNYEYVKGQGWVLCYGPTVTLRCGTVVMLVERFPEKGEPYTWCTDGEENWTKNGKPDLEYVANQFNREFYTGLSLMEDPEYNRAFRNRTYLTFVKV